MTTGPSDHQGEARQQHAPPWKRVWESRAVIPSGGSTLSQLLQADGYDTPFGTVEEASWVEFVARRTADLGIGPGVCVFDVGCGAGAFLYELHNKGCAVGGIDWASGLIDIARSVMPGGDFYIKEAAELDVEPRADVVVSCSTFEYFPSTEYARRVIERMAAKAKHAVAILDVPDRATEKAALADRRRSSGGTTSYAERYNGLDHRYYDRAWLGAILAGCGLEDVHVTDQDLAHYASAAFRFNAWGFKRHQS